jgi:purine-nucleoside phosphorylase
VTAPTPHIAAQPGEIADAVLLPGDPLRAQVVAETFFEGVTCYTKIRNMLGFTGTYKGRRISVQGTGMGVPSISIYVTELMRFYGVKTAIRIGSCGALRNDVQLRDVVIASSAHYTTSMIERWYPGIHFAPTADFDLLAAAHRISAEQKMSTRVGPILTSDCFYDDDVEMFKALAATGTLAVEMECAALYTIAAREGAKALCVATVSDHLVHHEFASAEERQTGFLDMARLALDTVVATTA